MADGYHLSESERETLNAKLDKLENWSRRAADESAAARVAIRQEGKHATPIFSVHVHVALPGKDLDAHLTGEPGETVLDLFDRVEEKLENQLKKAER